MFEALSQKHRERRGRRWFFFVLGSVVLNAVGIAGAWFLIPREVATGDLEAVPITFASRTEAPVEETEAPATPPPAPPPPPPVARSGGSWGEPGARMRKALEAPAGIPDRPPSETDVVRPPGSDQWTGQVGGGQASGGPGEADEAAAQPMAASGGDRRGPVSFNEAIDAPVPDPANRLPEYPEEARKAGVEGVVEVRIVISEKGAVSVVEAPRGEEPFVAAVMARLPEWRFRPARLDGEAVAVQRLVRVPFRLSR